MGHGSGFTELKGVDLAEHVIHGAKKIARVLGKRPAHEISIYRPPGGGWTDASAKFFSDGLGREFHAVHWDIDTVDWQSDGKNINAIVQRVRTGWGPDGGKQGHII